MEDGKLSTDWLKFEYWVKVKWVMSDGKLSNDWLKLER